MIPLARTIKATWSRRQLLGYDGGLIAAAGEALPCPNRRVGSRIIVATAGSANSSFSLTGSGDTVVTLLDSASSNLFKLYGVRFGAGLAPPTFGATISGVYFASAEFIAQDAALFGTAVVGYTAGNNITFTGPVLPRSGLLVALSVIRAASNSITGPGSSGFTHVVNRSESDVLTKNLVPAGATSGSFPTSGSGSSVSGGGWLVGIV